MPPRQEFDKALREVRDYTEKIGDEVEEELDAPEGADEEDTVIYSCRHGDNPFVIDAHRQRAYFRIVFPFDLVDAIREQIEVDDPTREFLSETLSMSVDNLDPQKVARSFVNNMPMEDRHGLLLTLVDRLSSPLTGYSMESTDEGAVEGFQVSKKIFPYEESFGLYEYEQAVQAVVSVGHRATRFLQYTLRFNVFPEEDPKYELRFELPGSASSPGSERVRSHEGPSVPELSENV